jgi:DNA modification methylase
LLNDLPNKEWLKFQKSWFVLNPKTRTKEVLLHPAKFPEELVESFIRFFTKRGQTVLDPMAGTGSTLIASLQNGRNTVGIELLDKYFQITKQRVMMAKEAIEMQDGKDFITISARLLQGDAGQIKKMDVPQVDYCITSPPYWDMLHAKGFETQKSRKEKGFDVLYSDDSRDLGNLSDYDEFLDTLSAIYAKVHDVIKPKGYITVIVKNVKKGGKIYPLAWDLARRLSSFFTLKDEKIWCQDNVKLAPYGYGRCWVSNTVHHYCLNFRKE